ncbi:hypothetical protein CA830_12795 [Burkholderia multivorans]|nr:hypothetical protein CA830_12795 [Burkholderia multivorans]
MPADRRRRTAAARGRRALRVVGARYYRVLKVARTIADLAGEPLPTASHIAEAIRYRRALAAL